MPMIYVFDDKKIIVAKKIDTDNLNKVLRHLREKKKGVKMVLRVIIRYGAETLLNDGNYIKFV